MFERNGRLLQDKFNEFLLPTILTTAGMALATVVDSIIVGNLLGEEALSAIGLVAPVMSATSMLFLLFTVGGVTCASVAMGQRDFRRANGAFTMTFAAGLAAMFALVLMLGAWAAPIANALAHGDAGLADMVYDYMLPTLVAGPIMALVMGIAQFSRTDGKPRIAAKISLIANGVNLVFSYCFIRFLGTGIAGAAWSTVLGYCAGLLAIIPYLRSAERGFRFVTPKLGDWAMLPKMLAIGLPKSLTYGMAFLRALVLNAIIMGSMGAPGMAAMTLCTNAWMIAMMFIAGTNDTILPIAGTLYGEGDYSGIRLAMKSAMRTIVAASVAVTLLFIFAPGLIAGLFGVRTPEGLSAAIPALRMYALCLPLYALNIMMSNFFQTTGREMFATGIVCMDHFLFVVPFALLLDSLSAPLLWLSFMLSELATLAAIFALCARIHKKEGVFGLLLLRETNQGVSLDLSVPTAMNCVPDAAAQIQAFCGRHGVGTKLANRITVAAEEMLSNITRHGKSTGNTVTDVLLRITDEKLIVRLRDDGVPFDPGTYRPADGPDFQFSGIEIVKKLADSVEYSRPLGFNCSIITVSLETSPAWKTSLAS